MELEISLEHLLGGRRKVGQGHWWQWWWIGVAVRWKMSVVPSDKYVEDDEKGGTSVFSPMGW